MNITESSSDGFYCETVYFPTPFQNGGTIRVFLSLSHEDHPGNENEASVAMVTSIDQNSFSLCLMESARPTGEMTLNWFAFSDSILPQGVLTGSVSYRVFTSGSSCNDVTFARVSFPQTSKILRNACLAALLQYFTPVIQFTNFGNVHGIRNNALDTFILIHDWPTAITNSFYLEADASC